MLKLSNLFLVILFNFIRCNELMSYCPFTYNCTANGVYLQNAIDITVFPIIDFVDANNTWFELSVTNTSIVIINSNAFDAFLNNTFIRIINLSFNRLSIIETGTFTPFGSTLETLILTGNRLKTFEFIADISLNSLYIDYNSLNDFQFDNNDKTIVLKELYLNNNNFYTIPNALSNYFNNLELLDLSDNQNLITIKKNKFSNLTNLKKLFLRNLNQLNCIDSDAFYGLTNLDELYLSSNGLQPDICWLNSLMNLQLIEYDNGSGKDDQYCTSFNNRCWIYLFGKMYNITVLNPHGGVCTIQTNSTTNLTPSCVKSCLNTIICVVGIGSNKSTTTSILAQQLATTTVPITDTFYNQKLAIILGTVLCILFIFFLTLIIIVAYFVYRKKYCFRTMLNIPKTIINSTATPTPTTENTYRSESQQIGRVNPLSFDNSSVILTANNNDTVDTTAWLDNSEHIGEIVNITEISDHNALNILFTDDPATYHYDNGGMTGDDEGVKNEKNVRFNSTVVVVENKRSSRSYDASFSSSSNSNTSINDTNALRRELINLSRTKL